MTNDEFDAALIAAAFAHGAEEGWRHVSAAAAARRAGLDLGQARGRFTHPGAILKKFGENADAYALTGAMTEGAPRDRLFDILLRRFDYLQIHRAGVLALLKSMALAPGLPLFLARENIKSMAWLLEAAGLPASGLRGTLRANGLLAIWAWGLRAWMRDESTDLAATMAAVDVALDRASQIAARFEPEPAPLASAAPEIFTPPPADEPFGEISEKPMMI